MTANLDEMKKALETISKGDGVDKSITHAVKPQKNPNIQKDENGIKIDRRHFNKHSPGSGRKTLEKTIINKGIKEWMDDHASELVDMNLIDKKTGRQVTIKKPRRVAVIEKIFEIGMKGDRVIGNVAALKEWMDRYAGKASQPIRGEGEDSPIRLHVDNLDRILEKAYGNED